VAALGWALVVGVVGALAGGLLMRFAEPVSMASGVGVILLIASPILAVSTGIVVAVSGRRRPRPGNAGSGRRDGSVDAPPLPAAGHVRIGYYKFRPGTVDGVARRLLAEATTLYAREPFCDECTKELWLLVGQRVTRVIDHREGGVRVVVHEVCSGRVPDCRVQSPRHDQRWTRVRRPLIAGELPSLADSLERRLVDERGRRADMAFVPLQHLRALDHEVAPELVVADLPRPDNDAVLRDLAQTRQQRTHQRETSDPPRLPLGHRLRVEGASRVTDEEVRSPLGHLAGEVEQRVEDVFGAAQPVGCHRPAHSGEVGIDPPEARDATEDRLEACLGLAVVHPGAVQHQHGSARPVLHVVDRDVARSRLHSSQSSDA